MSNQNISLNLVNERTIERFYEFEIEHISFSESLYAGMRKGVHCCVMCVVCERAYVWFNSPFTPSVVQLMKSL
jgi:hypothetical protein